MTLQTYSQRDDRWKLKKLGNGTGTIGSYGCTLTSITSGISAFGSTLTPLEANEKLKAVGGFGGTTENLIVWSALSKAFPQIKSVGIPEAYNNEKAKQMLDRGMPVVVKVNGSSIGASSHWCLLVGNQKMLDPWTGNIVPTSTYPILSLVAWELQKTETMADYYKGLDLTNKDSMRVAVDEWYNVSQGMYAKAEIVLQKDQMIKNLTGELGSCNSLRNQGISALEIAEKTIKGLEEEVRVYEEDKQKLIEMVQEERTNLSLAQKMFNEKSEEVSRLQSRVTQLEGQLAGGKDSDKPIPYKRLYESALEEIESYKGLIAREYIKKASSRIGQLLQRVVIDLESYINGKS